MRPFLVSSLLSCCLVAGRALQLGAAALRGDGPIAVDFYVFKGNDGEEIDVPPKASCNIGGEDATTGFYTLCKDKCPMKIVQKTSYTAPEMRWCPCIAELLVEDLSRDFGELLSPSGAGLFTLGSYVEVSAGQDFFDVQDGHGLLQKLLDSGPDTKYYRQPERLTVWVSQHIAGHEPGTILAGTTLLDQVLYEGVPGAGVLLAGHVSRMGRRLSHETGHVVGFHHVAGPPVHYSYFHDQCPGNTALVHWEMVSGPNCEVNIMGGWYDGPYCCPSFSVQKQLFFLQQRRNCLPQPEAGIESAYCCGASCTHKCPKEQPPMTFATAEHADILRRILSCWLHLRGMPPPGPAKTSGLLLGVPGNASSIASATVGSATVSNSTLAVPSPGPGQSRQHAIECVDYENDIGTCTVSATTSL